MKNVLIADDHAIVRVGVKRILSERNDVVVAGEAGTPEETIEQLRTTPYDLMILDISIGARNGLEFLKQVRREFPATAVLILSMHPEEQYAIRCLRAGASGYLTNNSAPADLMNAITRVLSGRRYVSPEIADQLATEVILGSDNRPHERLSDREFEVYRMLIIGKTVTEIAKLLQLSVKTVSTHRTHILEKMRMRSNADLIRYAMENGLR